MPRACGKYKIDQNSIKIVTDNDFCAFYRWLFRRTHYNTIQIQPPKHGAHIGVINPNIHKHIDGSPLDCSDYLYLNGREVWFDYTVEGNYGGFQKGFMNFWLNVECKEAEEILREFGYGEKTDGFSLFHITVGNNKHLTK
jgi:hypothetical protein